MRIQPRKDSTERTRHVAQELRRARELAPVRDPVCCAFCPDYKPSVGCHRNCSAAPKRLSSEGERSPVEPQVAPLVFELKRLGVFYPCWSCEGHANQAGDLWKIPRVWFYSDSVVHVRALANAVDDLYAGRQLSARWQLVLTHSDAANPDTTFSLEPEPAENSSLSPLQRDLCTMASGLARHFRAACDSLAAQVR